ncbi:MAG: hypothetical protein HS104_03115 [Polyangiaceae bacterium]|nr:hypothetical protein [Polyangiaceae bacterium]
MVGKLLDVAFAGTPAVTLEPYSKGGFVSCWTFEVAPGWNDAVVESIALGQRLGSGWLLSGNVASDVEAVLTNTGGGHCVISGVTMISWSLLRDTSGSPGRAV